MNTAIRPSRRASQIKQYYFAGKLRQIAEMQASGIEVISLGVGGPDLPPPAPAIEALCREAHSPSSHGYQIHSGIAPLREAFAEWYRRSYGVTLDPSTEILPLIGSKEGVTHISLTFLNPGDRVLVPNPGYPTYSSITRMAGAEPVYYDLTEENSWQPDFDAIEAAGLDGVRLMWLNYPHMPTGAQARTSTFRKVIELGLKHGILIVHDNPYSFILNPTPMSIMSIPGAMDTAIELNSLSKSHNMPGWRVGVAVGNPEFLSWILRVKSNIDSGQFRPIMLAAAEALKQGHEWNDELNRVYASRRKIAERIMEALGCTFDPSQTGLFLWGRITDKSVTSEALADRILDEAHVFITPGFIFGSNGDRYIRLSLCAPEDRLTQALERIRKTLA